MVIKVILDVSTINTHTHTHTHKKKKRKKKEKEKRDSISQHLETTMMAPCQSRVPIYI